jgi:transcriptional regulator of acetoin/glycerol metabolism
MMEATASHLADARMQLKSLHVVGLSNEIPRDPIRDSWQRCLEPGLDPAQAPRQVDRSSQELCALIDQQSHLIHLARSEFLKLKKQLPGDTCLLGFTNRDVILIEELRPEGYKT